MQTQEAGLPIALDHETNCLVLSFRQIPAGIELIISLNITVTVENNSISW